MNFALSGVTNEGSLRRFKFEPGRGGPSRTAVIVIADLVLVRKYEIPLQELPLLCLQLLESQIGEPDGTLVFPEEEMVEYANRRRTAKEQAQQRRRGFRPGRPNPRGDS